MNCGTEGTGHERKDLPDFSAVVAAQYTLVAGETESRIYS